MPKIGSTYHRIRMVSIKRIHDSKFLMMKVYGRKFADRDEWEYLGEYDVVKVADLTVDSVVPNSEFQLACYADGFKLIYAVDNMSIEFEEVD